MVQVKNFNWQFLNATTQQKHTTPVTYQSTPAPPTLLTITIEPNPAVAVGAGAKQTTIPGTTPPFRSETRLNSTYWSKRVFWAAKNSNSSYQPVGNLPLVSLSKTFSMVNFGLMGWDGLGSKISVNMSLICLHLQKWEILINILQICGTVWSRKSPNLELLTIGTYACGVDTQSFFLTMKLPYTVWGEGNTFKVYRGDSKCSIRWPQNLIKAPPALTANTDYVQDVI